MININEHMIGDYVYVTDAKGEKEITRLTESDFATKKRSYEKYDPVPLTEEIVARNGLRAQGREMKCEWFMDGKVQLYTLKYVHEVQHMLSVCHIEKEIVL